MTSVAEVGRSHVETARQNPLAPDALARVLALLEQRTGVGVEHRSVEPLGGEWAPVSRVTLDRELVIDGRSLGSSVVVKTARVDDGGGRAWVGGHRLANEEIAMRLLSGSGVAPQLIASDLDTGVVVMSDLAPARSVDDIIRGDDPTEATAALVALARAMGRMHALTAHLGDGEHADPHVLFGHWPGAHAWGDVERACAALGFPDARVARHDIAAVVAELSEPGPLLALTHTDTGPMNALFTRADMATFVDWEGCGFRHIGWDASWLQFPFPNCSDRWSVLPMAVVKAADDAYRAEVVEAIPVLGEEGTYRSMLAVGCAASLAVRVQRLPLLATEGQPPYDSWRRRTQLIHQIHVFVTVAAAASRLEALATWFADLADAMRSRWPDAWNPPPAVYSAFR